MEIGNCSLLDEGTATAEAMLMMFALRSREAVREGRNQLFVDCNIFRRRSTCCSCGELFGIELIVDEYDEYSFTGKEFGAIVQYPAANGAVRDYTDFTAAAHAKGVLVTAAVDLLRRRCSNPRRGGADRRRLDVTPGHPDGFGGPGAGYMATREAYKRKYARPHHRRLGRPPGATRRCAWRSRCANSISSANAPRRTSAPPRR